MEQTYKLCFTGARAPTSLSICTPARYADILCDRLRAYLRPVFEGETGFKDFPVDKPLDDYRNATTTWLTPEPNKIQAPWAQRLNSSMFYL